MPVVLTTILKHPDSFVQSLFTGFAFNNVFPSLAFCPIECNTEIIQSGRLILFKS